MTRVRVSLELPPDLDVDDDRVRGPLVDALHDQLCKSKHKHHRQLPHKHPQKMIHNATERYSEEMDQMISEILKVLAE